MPKLRIELKVEMSNIKCLELLSFDEYIFTFLVKCTKCQEKDGPITLKASDSATLENSKSTANFQMKCKFCKSNGELNILSKESPCKITAEDADVWTPFVVVEGRGLEVLII